MTLTQQIGSAVITEAKSQVINQATNHASNAANNFGILQSLPWPVILLLIALSIYAGLKLYQFLSWLFKALIVCGIGAALLLLGIKILNT